MKPTLTERDNLVKALVAARVGAGVIPSQVAKKARVRRSFIHMVECGDRKPSARVLAAYAALCGINGDDLCRQWDVVPLDVLERIRGNATVWEIVRAN